MQTSSRETPTQCIIIFQLSLMEKKLNQRILTINKSGKEIPRSSTGKTLG